MGKFKHDWDQRYRLGEHSNDPPLDFIARLLPEGDGRRALDIACGAGRHAALMAARGWQVTAVDWSEAALEMVRMRDPRIDAIAADLEAGTFEIERNCWDLICVSYYLQRDLFASIRDGLKPGGLVVAAFPMVDERADVRAMNPLYLLGAGELRAFFDGFEVLHDVETDPPAPKRRTAEILARKCRLTDTINEDFSLHANPSGTGHTGELCDGIRGQRLGGHLR